MSISSIKGLRAEMERKFKMTFILTHRTHQDCLENFFSQVRYRNGPSDHPSPVECLYNVKQIILGKNPGLAKHFKTNTIEREPEEYASASLLKLLSDGECSNEPGDNVETNSDCPDDFIGNIGNIGDAQFLEGSSDHIPDKHFEDSPEETTSMNWLTIELDIEILGDNDDLAGYSNFFTEEFLADLSTEMISGEPLATMKEDGLGN